MKLASNLQLSELDKSQVTESEVISNNPSPSYLFHEETISLKVVDEVINLIEHYKKYFTDESSKTCTNNGFQTQNIINIFNIELLKKIILFNNFFCKIFHIHYIKYKKGGSQKKHNHASSEKYSFILYLNNSDGETIFFEPINKKIYPEKGKLIVFNSNIDHEASPSFNGKQILVGAIEKI
jgi:hypothetical protein